MASPSLINVFDNVSINFCRTSGLLRSGALKHEERPLWYDVYAAFPPQIQPRYDRPAPNVTVQPIFYEEDVIRARYHKDNRNMGTVNLADDRRPTQSQQFIETFNRIRAQGALDEQSIYEAAADAIKDKLSRDYDNQPKETLGLLNSFEEAKNTADAAKVTAPSSADASRGIDIKNIFKD